MDKTTYYENTRMFDTDGKPKANILSDKRSSDFIVGLLKKYTTAVSNRYCMEFVLPKPFIDYIKKRDESLLDHFDRIKLNCSSITTPERYLSIVGSDDSPHEERIPNYNTIQDLTASFTCFSDMKERILFEYWIDFIFNPKSRTFMFLSEYATDFYIFQLDAKNVATYGIVAGRAFPSYISTIHYDYSQVNSPVQFNVSFTCQYVDTFNYSKSETDPDLPSIPGTVRV